MTRDELLKDYARIIDDLRARVATLEEALRRLQGKGCRVFQGLDVSCITQGYDEDGWCIGCVATRALAPTPSDEEMPK